MMMMYKPRRMHPAAVIFNFLRFMKELTFAIVAGFLAFKGTSFGYFIAAVIAVVVLALVFSFLSWYRYTYRMEGDELRIEYGIFIRKKRYISKHRIQSIDLTAGVIHRMLNLVKVQVETAGSGIDSEASLKAVRREDGEALRTMLKRMGEQPEDTEQISSDKSANPVKKITAKRLFIAGSTSGSIGVLAALFAFVFSELEQFIPDHFFEASYAWLIGLGITIIIGLAVVVLFLLWVLGIAGTMIKYGNFTIAKQGEELFITRGLLEKKQLTIPLQRIQAVGIEESMIRQPFGFATVYAEIAGGSLENGNEYSAVLFPILKKDEVASFLETFLPAYVPEERRLVPIPGKARKFYVLRSMLPVLLVAASIMYFFPQLNWVSAVLFIISGVFGWLRYQDGGFLIKGDRMTICYRVWNKRTVHLFHRRIQAFEMMQHPLQRNQGLATLKLSIVGMLGAGKHFKLKDLEERVVDRLFDWYSYQKKER